MSNFCRLKNNRFSINLQCGPSVNPRSDIALHLSADFNRNVIIRNTIQNWSWGVEESLGGMPLARGRPFQINVTCEASRFMVSREL